MNINEGDKVTVLGQPDIEGIVIKIHTTNEVVVECIIEDSSSEYSWPDNQLVYRPNELEIKQ